MAKQERTYTGAKTELKVSKGKLPTPYIHKVFDVTISDDSFERIHTDAYGNEFTLIEPVGIAALRSVFIFATSRKNTLSVMVVYLVPRYNKKGQLIAKTERMAVRVNPITKKVWKYQAKLSSRVNSVPGWEDSEWANEILRAVAA